MAKKRLANIIRDKFTAHSVDMMRVGEDVRDKVLLNLMQLDQELQQQILQANISGTARTDMQLRRAENLLNQTKATIASAYAEAATTLTDQLLEIADLQSHAVPALVNSVFRSELLSTSFTRNDLIVLAKNTLIEGAPSADWWAKQSADARMKFATQIRMGVLQGETNDELVARIIGKPIEQRVITTAPRREAITLGGEELSTTKTLDGSKFDIRVGGEVVEGKLTITPQVHTVDNMGKEILEPPKILLDGKEIKGLPKITVDGETLAKETFAAEKQVVTVWEGGVLDVTKQQATALVRSSVQTVSNEVLAQTYEQNENVLRGIQAIATLDLKTTPVCRGRDGAAWDFDGNPLPESPVQIPFPGNPPWHWQCRTITAPVVKSWDELSGMKGIAEIPASTRSSMDGQISEKITYEEWLRNQSEARQKQVLGAAKWELWKDNKLTMAQMIDQQGNPLTVSELKAKLDKD